MIIVVFVVGVLCGSIGTILWFKRPLKHHLVGPVDSINGEKFGLCSRCGKRNVSEKQKCSNED